MWPAVSTMEAPARTAAARAAAAFDDAPYASDDAIRTPSMLAVVDYAGAVRVYVSADVQPEGPIEGEGLERSPTVAVRASPDVPLQQRVLWSKQRPACMVLMVLHLHFRHRVDGNMRRPHPL